MARMKMEEKRLAVQKGHSYGDEVLLKHCDEVIPTTVAAREPIGVGKVTSNRKEGGLYNSKR